jgi:uncharacterized protein YgfB (UPF0149 family)
MTDAISFDQLQDLLMRQDLPITAGEIQGILTGLYAAGMPLNASDWHQRLINFIGTDESLLPGTTEAIVNAQKRLKEELIDAQGELTLLLPDDDAFIVDRAEAIVYWSQGFILGYQADDDKLAPSDDNAMEAFEDIKAISQLDLDSIAETEDDEKALFSLQEHLKVSALLVFHAQTIAEPTNDRLH